MSQIFLADIPVGSRIIEPCSDGSPYIVFDHLDGMYSYCVTERGNLVHLSRVTPLEKVGENEYRIVVPTPKLTPPTPPQDQ